MNQENLSQSTSLWVPRPYTCEEEKRIQNKLNEKLDPELVAYRPGPGNLM